jgi:ankyrin repeat protein
MSELKDDIKAAILSNDTAKAISLIDQYLKLGGNINAPLSNPPESEKNWNLMFWASLCQSSEILSYILSKEGVNINPVDTTGYTPLHLAAFHGRLACVKALLEHGADLKRKSNFGESLYELVILRPYLQGESLEIKEYIEKKLAEEGINFNT